MKQIYHYSKVKLQIKFNLMKLLTKSATSLHIASVKRVWTSEYSFL